MAMFSRVKTERTMLIICLLYGFSLAFAESVIDPWELQKYNALVLANQIERYIGYKRELRHWAFKDYLFLALNHL